MEQLAMNAVPRNNRMIQSTGDLICHKPTRQRSPRDFIPMPEKGFDTVAGMLALVIVLALAVQSTMGTRQPVMARLRLGGEVYYLNDVKPAIETLSKMLATFEEIDGTELYQAECCLYLGDALASIGKYEEAITKQNQALSIYQMIKGTEQQQAVCYVNIGVNAYHTGKYEEALAKQEQALAICKKIKGAERGQATCYQNIGAVLGNMGKYEEDIARQEQALAIYKKIKGTERNQAGCYQNIGAALLSMGEYQACIRNEEQALGMYRMVGNTVYEQAVCTVNIGVALDHLSKYEEAIAKHKQALKLFRGLKDTDHEQASCHARIGETNVRAGYHTKAIDRYIWSRRRVHSWWILKGLGTAYRLRGAKGDSQKAVRAFWEAIELAEKVRTGVMAFEHRAGIFEEPAQVFPDFVSLLADLSENKAKIEHPEVLSWSVDPRSDAALLEAAFHFADRGKGRAMEDALREKTTLEATRPDTKLLTEDKELSLRISKVASLREQLPAAEVKQRNGLTRQINELQQQRNMIEVELKRTVLGSYVLPEFRKPMEMAKELGPDTAVLQYSIGEKEGWLLILTQEGVTAHSIEAETPALPELLPRQEATLGRLTEAWGERPEKIGLDGLVRLTRMRAEDLGRKPKERHNLIGASQERAILERLGEVALPSSALSELRDKGIRHLLVIPDGSLHYAPFAMLRVEGGSGRASKEKQYLVEEFSISYTPAMTTLETIRKHKREREDKRKLQRRSLLAFANPDFREEILPGPDDMVTRVRSFRYGYYRDIGLRLTVLPETEQEAVRAGSLFAPVKIYRSPMAEVPEGQVVVCVSRAASEDQVKGLLGPSGKKGQKTRWRYLLFSTHGLADTRNGMLSCIALSSPLSDSIEDGFLQAQEVMDLELDADLVMLSACQTGLGRMRGGEGLVGLSSAFFYAGAESVCASLWQVPSGPTGQLVLEFFPDL